MPIFVHKEPDSLSSWAGEQWKPSPWLCRSLISIHSLWLIHWALTKTGARGLCDLIHVEYFGKNSGQLGVSNDYLEIYLGYLKLFCANMNYFWLLVLFLETEFIPAGCNDSFNAHVVTSLIFLYPLRLCMKTNRMS